MKVFLISFALVAMFTSCGTKNVEQVDSAKIDTTAVEVVDTLSVDTLTVDSIQ